MRKLRLLILFIIPFMVFTNVYASTTTYPRDENNLGVSSDIEVTEENKPFILNTPKVDASEKVYDFADLFSDSEEQLLYQMAISYINKTSYDIAIVTINDNPKSYYNGQSPTTVYADDFYDYNDFKRDGVLILIDMERREYYISTTGQAILMYDDYRIESILDAGESDMISGNYYSAANNMVNELDYYHEQGIPNSNRNCEITSDGDYVCYKTVPYFIIIIVSAIVTAIIMICTTKSYKKIKKTNDADRYMLGSKSKIDEKSDMFMYSNTVKTRRESSSSSGGSSGGSSSHSSSSGSSHGGGGRSF